MWKKPVVSGCAVATGNPIQCKTSSGRQIMAHSHQTFSTSSGCAPRLIYARFYLRPGKAAQRRLHTPVGRGLQRSFTKPAIRAARSICNGRRVTVRTFRTFATRANLASLNGKSAQGTAAAKLRIRDRPSERDRTFAVIHHDAVLLRCGPYDRPFVHLAAILKGVCKMRIGLP